MTGTPHSVGLQSILAQAGELTIQMGQAVVSREIFKTEDWPANRIDNPVGRVLAASGESLGKIGESGGTEAASGRDERHDDCNPTLRDIWDRHMRAEYADADTTAAEYRTVLKLWDKRIGRLPVVEITDQHLKTFKEALLKTRGPNTVRKLLRHLRAVIRRCGPRIDRNPRGLDLIERLPYVAMPAPDRKYVRACTLAEAGRLFDAAQWMKYRPRSCTVAAPDWWRAQEIIVWFHGIRTANLMLLDHTVVKSDAAVDADQDLREANFRRPFAWPHGWLVYCPKKTERRKPFPLILPLHPLTKAAFERLAPHRASGLMFGVPKFTTVKKHYYSAVATWGENAGIDWGISLDNVRKACSTAYNDIHASLGSYVLGHAPGRSGDQVNSVHYDAVLDRLRKAVDELAYPPEFNAWG